MLQTNAAQTARKQQYTDLWSHSIETDRIEMEVIKSEDAAELQSILGDPDVMQFVGLTAGEVLSGDEVRVIVGKAIDAWATRGYGRWTLRDKGTGLVMGFCGFRCEDGLPELICMLDKPYWNKGFGLEASRACLDHGFEVLNFNEVCVYSRPEHHRARRLLDKLGAEYTGNVDFHGVEGAAYVIGRFHLS